VVLTNAHIRDHVMAPSGDLIIAEAQQLTNLVSINICRFDAAGQLRWRIPIPGVGSAFDGGYLAIDGAENVFFAVRADPAGTVLLRKLDSSGREIWTLQEPISADRYPVIACDSSGNVAIVAIRNHSSGECYWLAKYDPTGAKLWETNQFKDNPYIVKSILAASSDDLWVSHVAYVNATEVSTLDKVSSNGELSWSYASPETISRFEPLSDGGALVLTSRALTRLSASGSVAWQRLNVDSLLSIEPNGDVVIGEGTTISYPAVPPGARIVRLDRAGNVLWQSPTPGDAIAFQRNEAGNYVGMMATNGYRGSPFHLGEITPDGEQLWLSVYTNATQTFHRPAQAFLKAPDETYRLLALRTFGSSESVIASLAPAPISGLPRITRQPDSTNILAGKVAMFKVEAIGDPPLKYEWVKRNVLITNENSSVLRVGAQSSSDNTDIFVEVSNARGRVRSRIAEMRVHHRPTPSFEVPVISAALNSSVQLQSFLEESWNTANTPFTFQWRYSGVALIGETNGTLTLTNVQPHHAGRYSVVARNPVGEATYARELIVTPSVREDWRYIPPHVWPTADRQIAVVSNDVYVADGSSVVKYSNSGQPVWTNYPASLVIPDGQGGVVIGLPWLSRYNSNGDLLWLHPQPGRSLNIASNWIAVGSDNDLWLYSLDGNDSRRVALACENCRWWSGVEKVLVTPHHEILCAGPVLADDVLTNVLGIAWVNLSGTNLAFANTGIPIPLYSRGEFDVAATPDGGAVAAVLIPAGPDRYRDIVTVAFDRRGEVLWSIATKSSEQEYFHDYLYPQIQVATDDSGNVIVAADYIFIKYDSSGAELWRARSGHAAFGVERPKDLKVTAAGDIYLLGGAPNVYSVVEKLDPMGNSLWVATLAGGSPFATGLHVTDAGEVYVSVVPDLLTIPIVTAKLVESVHPEAPRITSNPAPHYIPVGAGGSVSLSASATGAEPLSYQWFYDASMTPILGATNAVLHLDNVSLSQSGVFFLEVRNAHGSVVTRPVQISAGLPPQFEIWDGGPLMASSLARVNEDASVLLRAHGYEFSPYGQPQGWQWSYNGQDIPGATSPAFLISNATAARAGTYTLRVSNIYGTSTRSISLLVETTVRTLFTLERPVEGPGVPQYLDPAPHLAANASSQLYFLGSVSNSPSWFLSKYRANGERIWNRQFGPMAAPAGMVIDANQNVVVAGTGVYNRKGVAIVVKYDPTGSVLWERRVTSTTGGRRHTTAFIQNSAGTLYLAGFDESRVFVAKLTANGSLAWTRYISPPPDNYYESPTLAAARDGGVYLAGRLGLIRFTAAGQRLWTRGRDFFKAAVGPAGNVYTIGFNGTAKYTSSGTLLWTLPIRGHDIKVDTNGVLLSSELYVQRLTPDGATVWRTSLYASTLELDGLGRAYAHTTWGALVTRAFDLQGQELWQATAAAESLFNVGPVDIVVCPNGDVAIAQFLEGKYFLTRYRPTAMPAPPALTVSVDQAGPVVPGTPVCINAQSATILHSIAWFRNSVQLPAQTNSTLCLKADLDTAGTYTMTALSSEGRLVSAEVPLQLQRPFLYPLQRNLDDQILLKILPHEQYGSITLEGSSDLRNWHTITNFSAGFLPSSILIPNTESAQFFRARGQ